MSPTNEEVPVEAAIDGEVIEEHDDAVPTPEQAQQIANTLPAVRQSEAMVAKGEITVDELVAQRDKVKEVMARAMRADVHYGIIPGTQGKPTLLKPGAETLCVMLRLSPSYRSERHFHEGGHLTVITNCSLTHITTGLVVAEGEGLCSSMEEKYAFRGGSRLCPACNKATIKKSKFAPRENDYPGANSSHAPGWYCFGKVGGCGMQFHAEDPAIIGQSEEKQPNPNIADTYNTVLKMANKRALIAAVLNGTAASDIFTQDVEDMTPNSSTVDPAQTAPRASQQPAGASAAPSGGSQPAQNATGAATGSKRKPSERQFNLLQALRGELTAAGLFTDEAWHKALQKDYGVESSNDLDSSACSKLIDRLQKAKKSLADVTEGSGAPNATSELEDAETAQIADEAFSGPPVQS